MNKVVLSIGALFYPKCLCKHPTGAFSIFFMFKVGVFAEEDERRVQEVY